jgi:hypothetical protein
MRTESEKEFSDWLLEVSDDKSGEPISVSPSCFRYIQDLVEQFNRDINFNTVTAQQLEGRAGLSVTNYNGTSQY